MTLDTVSKMNMGAIKACMEARVAPMLVGAPGVGKTAMIRSLADEMGYELITILGSQLDTTDLTGLPKGEKIIEREDGNHVYGTVYLSPWWQIRILTHKKVILFLDEFSNTSPAVRATMLTMLQNREFPNGEVMPKETIVMGAMNPSEQAADGYELDLPTTNRMFFIAWNPSHKAWFDGMLTNWGKEASPEEMTWKRKVVGFIKDNPTWLHKEPQDVETHEVYGIDPNNLSQMEVQRSAWASRRSWDNLSKVLANSPDDVSIQDIIIQGLVGFAASAAFREWLRRNDVIDPNQVLKSPKSFNWKEMSLDDSNLVLRAIIDMINDETSAAALNVFDVIADAGRQDIGAPFIRDLITKSTSRALKPEVVRDNKKAAHSVLAKYRSVTKYSTSK